MDETGAASSLVSSGEPLLAVGAYVEVNFGAASRGRAGPPQNLARIHSLHDVPQHHPGAAARVVAVSRDSKIYSLQWLVPLDVIRHVDLLRPWYQAGGGGGGRGSNEGGGKRREESLLSCFIPNCVLAPPLTQLLYFFLQSQSHLPLCSSSSPPTQPRPLCTNTTNVCVRKAPSVSGARRRGISREAAVAALSPVRSWR